MVKTVADASSLLLMIKHLNPRDLISIAKELTVLDLSAYEVSNALWKAVKLLKNLDRKEAILIHKTLFVFLQHCSTLCLEDLNHDTIMDIALEKRLTYYDASYLYAAASMKLPLTTEDRKLREASPEGSVTISWNEFLEKSRF